MRASNYFISTLKEHPTEAEVVSHQLMIRAGFIEKLAGGIYSYLPLGLKVLRKIEQIVREEMIAAKSIELLMPAIQPAELWKKTKRWEKFGPELFKLKDRHQRDFLISPTHEEVVTELMRKHYKSYRQLPLNVFQIQTKFRDEIRPRFGLMRGREFVMKDAYSFDTDEAGMDTSYQNMLKAYVRIFSRMNLFFRVVEADTGSIGGTGSTEFHVITETGEDTLVYCPSSGYAANIEIAEALPLLKERQKPEQIISKIATPGQIKCETVAQYLNIPLTQTVKSVVIKTTNEEKENFVLLLLRGDHTLNETKIRKIKGLNNWQFCTEDEIFSIFGSPPGYLGPINTRLPVRIIVDKTVAKMSNFVCGANEFGYHFTGVNWGRDLEEPEIADIRNVVEGDHSPDGHGKLNICRGIEVGHIFKLGTTYSKPLSAQVVNHEQKLQLVYMGCYGIGISRLLSASIEQNHDDHGMIWPTSIAPFEIVICPINYKANEVYQSAKKLYQAFVSKGIDVIIDDREVRPGVMFADWDLIGIPHQIIVSPKLIKQEKVEYKYRKTNEKKIFSLEEVLNQICALVFQERCISNRI